MNNEYKASLIGDKEKNIIEFHKFFQRKGTVPDNIKPQYEKVMKEAKENEVSLDTIESVWDEFGNGTYILFENNVFSSIESVRNAIRENGFIHSQY